MTFAPALVFICVENVHNFAFEILGSICRCWSHWISRGNFQTFQGDEGQPCVTMGTNWASKAMIIYLFSENDNITKKLLLPFISWKNYFGKSIVTKNWIYFLQFQWQSWGLFQHISKQVPDQTNVINFKILNGHRILKQLSDL